MSLSEGLIFGACNPLLDISTKVDVALLEKYKLKANSAILGDESHDQIYDDIKDNEIEYIPGGSAQNALRTASWILKYPNVCTFMGCIGKDNYADIMKEKAKEVGLNTVYQVNEKTPTGKCAVLITGNERSLVAHLGAANCFTQDHLDNESHWSYIQKAKILYVSGFFFTVSPESILRFAKFACENNRTFSINLSAPFICQFFKDKLMSALPYVDILFGNEDEAQTFSKYALDHETTDIKAIAKAISKMPKQNNKKRIVIITQGDKPVILANGKLGIFAPAAYQHSIY
jgi:adenosine kinase